MRRTHVWWNARRGRARADAADLLETHGGLAPDVARRLARRERLGLPIAPALPGGHWQCVLREVLKGPARAGDGGRP